MRGEIWNVLNVFRRDPKTKNEYNEVVEGLEALEVDIPTKEEILLKVIA